MSDQIEGGASAARLGRLRVLMAERGYDAVVVRDEANLRWLTDATGVFDFTFEFPHVAFITNDACFLHTDSRYFNTFAEKLPTGHPWKLDMDGFDMPGWVAERARECRARTVAVEDDMQIAFYNGILRGLEDRSIACALPLMHGDIQRLRAVKDAGEVGLMRRAQAITDAAFEHMLGVIRPGLTEKELRSELEGFMFSHGADGLAFASIVASGPNTANPHAVPGDRAVREGDFVLMDYGASYRDYCSDMTRTVVVGEPSARHREIYDLVRRCHEECAAAVRAGVDGNDVFELSRKIIGDAGYGACYNHGLGHGVGIDIHEQPSFGRRKMEIPEGAVITMEPGVYVPGFGGARLEDYGLVTADGYDVFTTSPHELQVIAC